MYPVESSAMNDWKQIYDSQPYRHMVASKTRAICTMTVFFIVYYFALPILVGYWPDLMGRPVWGNVNWAYLFAFSQFLMTWGIALVYMRLAGQFDTAAESILAAASASGAAPSTEQGGE